MTGSQDDRIASPDISVVVVNHNRVDFLKECLKSLFRQTLPPREIIVVDNASQDGSREFLRSLSHPRLVLLELDNNQGFAAANNRAFEIARGDFVALLNNDAVADPRWLEFLVEPLLQSPRCGMSASKILLDRETIDKVGHLIFWDGQNRGRGTGQLDRGQYDQPGEALLPDGCAALYRKEVVQQTGGMDEAFFAYADDADFGLRARWLGWSCSYVPTAVVWHRQSATTSPYSREKIFWIERNRVWLAVKNLPWFLLLVSPLLTLYRWTWNLAAALSGRGAAGKFRQQDGWGESSRVILTANWAALADLRAVWKKRREVRRRRRISDWAFFRLIWQFRISARELAFEDPERGRRES